MVQRDVTCNGFMHELNLYAQIQHVKTVSCATEFNNHSSRAHSIRNRPIILNMRTTALLRISFAHGPAIAYLICELAGGWPWVGGWLKFALRDCEWVLVTMGEIEADCCFLGASS